MCVGGGGITHVSFFSLFLPNGGGETPPYQGQFFSLFKGCIIWGWVFQFSFMFYGSWRRIHSKGSGLRD